jgi:hypothetical protein
MPKKHERGGVQVYETALQCADNDDLKDEWEEYLEQTRRHVKVLTEIATSRREGGCRAP